MEKVPYLGETLVRWRVGNSTFLAMPERGARLMNWNVTLGDGSVRDVLYWPELKNLDGFAKVRGGNPILFPFAARSFDQGDLQFWRDTDGTRRPMPVHGFARQGQFRTTRLDARGFAAQFIPGPEAREAYPFDYEFTVTYRFEPLSLSCEFTLRNLGRVPLPWCAGHHFYFTVPWSEGLARKDYLIRIPATKRWRQDPHGRLLPGPALPGDVPLSEPGLIDTFHTGLTRNEVVFGEPGRPGDVVVLIGSERRPHPDLAVVTWTQEATSPFYCVEPWMGPANAPEHKMGLQTVPPGQVGSFVVGVSVR